MIYFTDSSMGCWKECILCCYWMQYSVDIISLLWSMVSFSSRISWLIFCLDDLSVGDRRVFKSPTTTVLEFICAFMFFSVCLMKLSTLTLGAYRLITVISFWYIARFISKEVSFFMFFDQCKFEDYFVWYNYCFSCLLWLSKSSSSLSP
jgi:hypothetical protein